MKKVVIVSVLCLFLGACESAREERMGQGALIGGAGGAIIGGVASGTPQGAIIGGVAGAAVGAVAADKTEHIKTMFDARLARNHDNIQTIAV